MSTLTTQNTTDPSVNQQSKAYVRAHNFTTIGNKVENTASIIFSTLSALVIATSLMSLSSASLASNNTNEFDYSPTAQHDSKNYYKEPALSGWAVSFDNDILVPSSRDQDYTYGSSVTVAGASTRDYRLSLHNPLSWINQKIGVASHNQAPISHSVEAGLYGFTPEDISPSNPNTDDRPYASLIYWSSTQELATASPNSIWRSTLTLGVLGLDMVGDLQNEAHRLTSSDRANGWNNQISDGGELTARYSIAKQTRWKIDHPNIEVKTSTQASLGYLTEVSWGTSLRLGKISSRWQSHNPELTTYGEQSNQSVDEQHLVERYFLLGAGIKARAYNVFLQGQFRDNPVEYSSDDLNKIIYEAWAGYTHSFESGYRVSYLLRAHSSEVKHGSGDRNLLWGGLTLSRFY